MDEKGSMGGNAGGRDESADARVGMLQVNDLIYRLEPDMSVGINRTHKTNFFQNDTYTNQQTSIAILNSGSDYVDPRRTFLSCEILIPTTDLTSLGLVQLVDYPNFRNAFISCYFGANGSVLNLIDSVVVSTRSGDELSRINDFGQLQNMLIPEMFSEEWRNTIGQEIGLGSFLGGRNNATLLPGAGAFVPPIVSDAASEQQRQKFVIPLYLLSPIFNYGRLLPSMLMSGLRIEIKWKPLDLACQQFWEGLRVEWPADGQRASDPRLMDDDVTEFKTWFYDNTLSGGGGISAFGAAGDTYDWDQDDAAGGNGVLTGAFVNGGNPGFQALDDISGGTALRPGDIFVFRRGNPGGPGEYDREFRFIVQRVIDRDHIRAEASYASFAAPVTADWNPQGLGVVGPWRVTNQVRPNGYQREFGAYMLHRQRRTPIGFLQNYLINKPEISLCSITLTDAIQRTLNEYSAQNGLEIVYADYDRTSTPLSGLNCPIYTEVRKSASRALMAFGRVVQATASPHTYDSFASMAGSFWNHYQWQLGSLYFPNQRVQDQNTVDALRRDNQLALMYAHTQDAFDRFHPKAASTMATMRGHGLDWNFINTHPIEVHAEHSPSTYLKPPSLFGKWGSFVNGGTIVATTLERSTLFDLSGIPINNSRVLALRGEVSLPPTGPVATLYIFLKYVRLARVFLVNCEVEQ